MKNFENIFLATIRIKEDLKVDNISNKEAPFKALLRKKEPRLSTVTVTVALFKSQPIHNQQQKSLPDRDIPVKS